jgi:hypothetical protein
MIKSILLQSDDTVIVVDNPNGEDITLENGEIYRAVLLTDNYGRTYWIYLLHWESATKQ